MNSFIFIFISVALFIQNNVFVSSDFSSYPAVVMDYKVKIDAGKEDCYFQFVNPGATFYASFQVTSIETIELKFSVFSYQINP